MTAKRSLRRRPARWRPHLAAALIVGAAGALLLGSLGIAAACMAALLVLAIVQP